MYVELSYEFDKNMPIYPGSPEEEVIPITRMNQNGPSNTTTIKHFLHNGTHIDAPFHFCNIIMVVLLIKYLLRILFTKDP